ncbi:hypothetical protein D9M68_844370 [compost metagenome]
MPGSVTINTVRAPRSAHKAASRRAEPLAQMICAVVAKLNGCMECSSFCSAQRGAHGSPSPRDHACADVIQHRHTPDEEKSSPSKSKALLFLNFSLVISRIQQMNIPTFDPNLLHLFDALNRRRQLLDGPASADPRRPAADRGEAFDPAGSLAANLWRPFRYGARFFTSADA